MMNRFFMTACTTMFLNTSVDEWMARSGNRQCYIKASVRNANRKVYLFAWPVSGDYADELVFRVGIVSMQRRIFDDLYKSSVVVIVELLALIFDIDCA